MTSRPTFAVRLPFSVCEFKPAPSAWLATDLKPIEISMFIRATGPTRTSTGAREAMQKFGARTLVVHKDVLCVIGSSFGKKATIAVRAGGRGDVSKMHVLWTNLKVDASYCSPLLVGDRLYFFSSLATPA